MANPTADAPMEEGVVAPTAFTNIFGAVISMALLAGIVIWGAQTLMRDASGVPVVRALDGPMRVAPENPGGQATQNQGLSVNHVASSQEAPVVSDELRLAPRPVRIDDALANTTDAPLTVETTPIPTEIEALAAQLAAATAPLAELQPTSAEPTELSLTLGPTPVSASGGLVRSLRPQGRPSALPITQVAAAAVQPTVFGDTAVSAGTRLAQLAAVGSRPLAEREWARLASKFSSYFADKSPVVQEVQINGQTLYRLRATGFADAGAARRFCAALVNEGTSCFPVVMQ